MNDELIKKRKEQQKQQLKREAKGIRFEKACLINH